MAFPQDITEFLRATDPQTTTDVNNIIEFQRILLEQGPADAQNFLSDHPELVPMNINAGRFNEVLQTVEDIENFMVGDESTYKNYIQNNINAYSDIALWTTNTQYFGTNATGSVVSYNGRYFVCKQAHTSSSDNEPIVGEQWQTYWNILVDHQYPISETQPVDQIEGDIWFQVIPQQ